MIVAWFFGLTPPQRCPCVLWSQWYIHCLGYWASTPLKQIRKMHCQTIFFHFPIYIFAYFSGGNFFFKKSISRLLVKLQTSNWAQMKANFQGYLWAKDGSCSSSSSGATACIIWQKGRFFCFCCFYVLNNPTVTLKILASSWAINLRLGSN